jgi:hypothetical protein
VRVLLTVGEWDATEGVWSHGGLRLTLLKTWQAIVEDHVKAWPSASLLGVLVGEWCDAVPPRPDHRLRFYSYLIDANAALSTDNTGVLFERIIQYPHLWRVSEPACVGDLFARAGPSKSGPVLLRGENTT